MATWKNAVPEASAQFNSKREVLIREAAAAFNRRGYYGTSLTEIAKKLGVTKAALYTYVPSKEELLYFCHDSAMDTAIGIVEAVRKESGTGLEKLTRALRSYLEMMLGEDGSYVVLLEEHAMKPEHMRAIIKRRDQFESSLRAFVEDGIADGSIVSCNPKLAIFMVTGALNWSRKWYRPDGNWSGPQIAYALTQMLERSLSGSPLDALLDDPGLFDVALEVDTAAAVESKTEKGRRRPA
ncbi:MAG: TetR family transcriptional regulator [Burkholderiaceae bacterium]|nr:TetR family transcriptional regulator [Burkholderiaceae bacterium]